MRIYSSSLLNSLPKSLAVVVVLSASSGLAFAVSQSQNVVAPAVVAPAAVAPFPELPVSLTKFAQSVTRNSIAANANVDANAPATSEESVNSSVALGVVTRGDFSVCTISQAQIPARVSRNLRVGLSTSGGPIVLLSSTQMTVSDAAQSGRRMVIPAGQTVMFNLGATQTVAARGQSWSGNITLQTDNLSYAGWRTPHIDVAAGGVTSVASDGGNPRGRRAYHGDFELAPQTFSFEPALHKSPLQLVNVLPLDEYLKGVVPWEMDAAAPLEALKAQAICARSETLADIVAGRHKADGFDICDYDHCQGYSGTENEKAASDRAVEETSGIVISRDGHVSTAVYGTNSGGITSSSEDVWRGTPEAYLKSVRDFSPSRHPEIAKLLRTPMTEAKWAIYCTRNLSSFAQPSAAEVRDLAARRRRNARTAALFQADDLPEFYRWTRVFSPAQIALLLRAPNAIATEVRVLDRSPSGHIKRLQVVGHDAKGAALFATYEKDSQIRAMFSGRLGSTTALPSSTFVVQPQRDAKKQIVGWVFKGAGWGHGAGMCQRGAQNHALAGWSARKIINWYFYGVTLARLSQ